MFGFKYHRFEESSDLLKSDRKFTCDEIATEVSISKGSVHTIIRDHLGMWNVEGSSSLGTPLSDFGSN